MMMGFEWWFAALALLAAVFVAWPVLGGRRHETDGDEAGDFAQRKAFNDALYAEQLEELERQRAADEITAGQFDKLKQELDSQHEQDNALDAATISHRQFRKGWWVVVATAVLLPAVSFFLYQSMGAADDWEIQRLNDELVRQQQRGADARTLEAINSELHTKLQARLEEQPDNLNNRFLLARTAVEMGELGEALTAYQYILERQPNSPRVVGEMAQVLFMAAGNRFTSEVQQVFDRALEMDPQNSELLGFAGIGAYQSGKFELAIDYWERGMQVLESSDPRYQTWQRAIAQARGQLGEDAPVADSREGEQPADTAGDGASIQVELALGEQVQAKPGDRVFVYARAWQGARMPLAMQQIRVSDLPTTLELNDSMSMIEGMNMSRFPQLEIVARISSSGSAEAQSGDWQASFGPVDSQAAGETIKLQIDSQIP
ncbi:c-type cytochrome biogenesis protein CcmI [Gilvimarinus sp. F26214L]|uniref:c-type cytochrome biogenesis protein CcmI n=1 Tax=Gilvimarinus sp. DZF01 TaxID=3461371 RepID=UPI0040461A26